MTVSPTSFGFAVLPVWSCQTWVFPLYAEKALSRRQRIQESGTVATGPGSVVPCVLGCVEPCPRVIQSQDDRVSGVGLAGRFLSFDVRASRTGRRRGRRRRTKVDLVVDTRKDSQERSPVSSSVVEGDHLGASKALLAERLFDCSRAAYQC